MPEPDPSLSRRAHWWQRWGIAVLAGVTVALGAAVPLAPVTADAPVVSWPRAGEAATSTVLPLSPYRPLELAATVPCAALRQVESAPAPGDALRTVPFDAGTAAAQGLTVRAESGQVMVAASGRELVTETLPAGDCEYRVLAGATGMRVERDGTVLAEAADLPVPQVAQLATDAEETAGLAATLRTDDRYASSPTALKTVLLVAHLLAVAALLVLAWRRWSGTGERLDRPRRSPADLAVLLIGLAWVVLSPYNFDDSWYMLMARNAPDAGYIGNYIYMFNSTENPFVLSQYAMQLWGAIGGWGLPWMRLLPLLYGLATWVLLRWLLAVVLGRAGRTRWVPWALLVGFLVWWLPYEMALRPEPLIVTMAAATLLCAEIARRRRAIGALAAATACATLAVLCSPSGVVAAAPLVVALPWLVRWLRDNRWPARLTAVLLAAGAATVAIPVGFADATLGDVAESIAVHQWYYLTIPWYDEIVHYQTLLVNRDTSWGRRAPVLLTLAALVVVAIGAGRRAPPGDAVRGLLLSSAVTSALALALLVFTPTKWVNHFGAAAAAPMVLLAAAMLRTPLTRSTGIYARVAALAVVCFGAVLSFAGPNIWRPYSDRGQPFGDHLVPSPTQVQVTEQAPHFGPLFLRNPLVWLAVAGLAAAWGWWRQRRGRGSAMTPERAVLVTASVTVVALLGAVFGYAPLSQAPGWTLASSTVDAVRGNPCGLANDAQVLLPTGPQPGPPSGEGARVGEFVDGADAPPPLNPPRPGARVWHDALPFGSTGTGSVSTGWFPIAGQATHLSVPVAGPSLPGQELEVQFGEGDPAAPSPLTPVALVPDTNVAPDTWQDLAVELPPGAVAVRLRAADRMVGPDTWLAVSEPSVTSWRPVPELTAGQPVFADQLSAALWPCGRQVPVRHGVAGAADVRLLADEDFVPGLLVNHVYPDWGGVFVQADRTADYVRVASRLDPAGPVAPPWGAVDRVLYDHPVGLVDTTVARETRAGWTRLPTLADEAYTGRIYSG